MMTGLELAHGPATALMVVSACLLDRLIGEPSRWHPLVGFGTISNRVDRWCNPAGLSKAAALWRGLICWCVLVLIPAIAVSLLLDHLPAPLQMVAGTVLLYLVIGGRSLQEHANQVRQDLAVGDLDKARTHVSWLVSRDTRSLDESGVSKACIESVLENGNDALFAPLFWFCLLGPAGAILYRLANTLDAMWGYRTPRYLYFGRAAARLDDVLNYFPARLTALAYALVGNTRLALQCWRRQAPGWDSPNAGPVMAAGAGALGLQLGGAADYHGSTESRIALGDGSVPTPADIGRSQRLLQHALRLWLVVIAGAALMRQIF